MSRAEPAPQEAPQERPLGGRVALVTGANGGIGEVVATELARAGARVVLACRDEVRGGMACERVVAAVPTASVELLPVDLADLASVRSAAAELHDHLAALDVLVANAAVMALPERRTSPQGFELHLATNHLGHFALTGLLLDLLVARPGARVVTVSSMAHRFGRIDLADLQMARRYRPYAAYGRSKLANLLFAFELQRRATRHGLDLVSVAAHPGIVRTPLWHTGPSAGGGWAASLRHHGAAAATAVLGQSPADGARSVVLAATDPDVVPGGCYGPGGPGGLRGPPRLDVLPSAARDEQLAAALWARSEDLTGVAYLD